MRSATLGPFYCRRIVRHRKTCFLFLGTLIPISHPSRHVQSTWWTRRVPPPLRGKIAMSAGDLGARPDRRANN